MPRLDADLFYTGDETLSIALEEIRNVDQFQKSCAEIGGGEFISKNGDDGAEAKAKINQDKVAIRVRLLEDGAGSSRESKKKVINFCHSKTGGETQVAQVLCMNTIDYYFEAKPAVVDVLENQGIISKDDATLLKSIIARRTNPHLYDPKSQDFRGRFES